MCIPMCLMLSLGFPGSSVGKESTCNARDPSLIPGPGRSAGEGIGYALRYSWAPPCGSAGKESTCNAGYLDSIPGLGRSPWRRERLPSPVFWPREFHGLSMGSQSQTRLSNFHFTSLMLSVKLCVLVGYDSCAEELLVCLSVVYLSPSCGISAGYQG